MKTNVVITHSGNHYQITKEQDEKLKRIGLNDFFEIDGNLVKGSSIAEVMTIGEYYRAYPEKIPAKTLNLLPIYESPLRKTKDPVALENMIIGLEKYINGPEYKGTDEPKNILKMMREKLRMVKEGKGDSFRDDNWFNQFKINHLGKKLG